MKKYLACFFVCILLFACSYKRHIKAMCKPIALQSNCHLDSVVIYAISSSDLVFDATGYINPQIIKVKGQRFVNRDSIVLKKMDTVLITNAEFIAYSAKSFALNTEYAEIGESLGFFHVYELYFTVYNEKYVTQIASEWNYYMYLGYCHYGVCQNLMRSIRILNAPFIKFKRL